jgi:hypothetical protein
MNIEIVMLGTSPLLMHNPSLIDPDNPITRAIKSLTSKRKKTDEDLRQIDNLEWRGGLYTEKNGKEEIVVQPSSKARKCFINAAKINKLGKGVERSVTMLTLNVPLIYDGPRNISELHENPALRSRLSVVIGGKRIMRCRPQFNPWGLVVPAVFNENAGLNFDELQRIVELAGLVERIGDNRVNGYGAFRAYVRDSGERSYKPLDSTIKALVSFFDSLDKKES